MRLSALPAVSWRIALAVSERHDPAGYDKLRR